VNRALISGLNNPSDVAILGGNVFVANAGGEAGSFSGSIGEYTTSGEPVNAALVSGLDEPSGIAVVPEPGISILILIGLAGASGVFFLRRPA
jgi:hypothetical protein